MGTSVLVVDDAPKMGKMLVAMLHEAGYTVTHVPTSERALPVLRASESPMVVVICTRCGTSLLEAAERDQRIGRHAVVLETAIADMLPARWRHLVADLHVPVLAKPFEMNTFLATVEHAAASLRLSELSATQSVEVSVDSQTANRRVGQ